MKVLVCGGRSFFNWPFVRDSLDDFHLCAAPITCVVQGGAAGADRLAKHWAEIRKIECLEYPANWDIHFRRAGYIRNREMLEKNPDVEQIIAFPGGEGTQMMKQIARERGLPVIEYNVEEPPF